jgi:L-rhamnose-H+ transport protein
VEEAMRFGLIAVLLGGVFQGAVLLPMKFTKRWQWENTWLCFACVAYLLSPWVIAFVRVPGFPHMLGDINSRTLRATLLFGAGMGAGALMMGLAYKYVGMAITFAIVLGISSSIGTLVPLMVLAPEQVLRHQGLTIMAGVAVALLGTVVVTWAAWERDAAKKTSDAAQPTAASSTRSLITGLALAVASGVLSSCGNLGFAFGGLISQRAHDLGAGPTGSASALWSVILFPVFLWNVGYSLLLLHKNKTGHLFREPGTAHYWLLSIIMGIDWMAGMAAYGAGALSLGKMGTSMGWILFVASMIIVANILGALTGEWKGARPKTLAIMAGGIVILLIAIVVVGNAGATA